MQSGLYLFEKSYENPERIFNIKIDNYDGGFQDGQYFRKSGHQKALCISDNGIDIDRERYEATLAPDTNGR